VIKKFLRFGIVGGLNTAVTLLIFYVSHHVLLINYLITSVLAYAAGIVNSYIWNRHWTFGSETGAIATEFSKFTILNLIGLALNTIFVAIFVELGHLKPLISQVIAILIIFLWNFLGNYYWVFKAQNSD
jgi:putative flippase GtrA